MEEQTETDLKKRVQIFKHSVLDMQKEIDLHNDKLKSTSHDFGSILSKVNRSVQKIRDMKHVSFSHTFYKIVMTLVFILLIYFILF